MFKTTIARLGLTLIAMVATTVITSQTASAYSNSRLMDDVVFDNVNSMSEQQIRDFINSHPNTCLTRVGDKLGGGNVFPEPITYWSYGPNNVDAARVIYNAARYNDLNPQVILATLQKEQSLITDNDCLDQNGVERLPKAMGQGCPDGGACPDPAYAGFEKQVMKGSWQLKFNKERANGNVNWGDNGSISYNGPWTEGNRAACATCTPVYRDGYWTIDGQLLKMETGATASFYRYTPHLGQALPGIFENYFGSTLVPTYGWKLEGQYAYTDQTKTVGRGTTGLLPGDKVYVGFRAKNMGNTTWTNSGPNLIKVGTLGPQDRNSPFCDAWLGCTRPATMKEASVAPGEVGTFEFWMKAPSPGSYNERFGLVIEGKSWLPDMGLNFYSTVVTPVYSWQLQWQYSYADETKAVGKSTTNMVFGDKAYVGFIAKNTGNVTWYRDGANPVHVGMTNPIDRFSPFYDGSWLGPNRPATMKEASVAPGQTATFEFWFTAPKQGGNYREYYSLVAEHAAWMNDPGMNFYATVANPVFSWQKEWQFAYTDQTKTTGATTFGMTPGQRIYVGFLAKNTGNVTWRRDGPNPVNVGMTHPIDRYSPFYDSTWLGYNRPARMKEAEVAPGQVATFEFWYKAPAQKGTYLEYYSLVSEWASWFNDPGMNFYTTVQ